jgi:hypothetical protein
MFTQPSCSNPSLTGETRSNQPLQSNIGYVALRAQTVPEKITIKINPDFLKRKEQLGDLVNFLF